MTKLRWGILGTGNIATQFAQGVAGAKRSQIVAVGSRTQATADQFARAFNIPTAHDSYDALLANPDVDAVYLSLPNDMHCQWTLRALDAGKHVLCEKPFASNAPEARQMFEAADRAGLLLVEAFMYRSHPLIKAVREEIRAGAIGKLKLIRANFCYRTQVIATNIRFSPERQGGALMDAGCYCIDFAQLIAGEPPTSVQGVGHIHETGVDEYAAGTLTFANGVLASFTCGMTVQANNTAFICGDEGYIEIPIPWKPPVSGAKYVVGQMTPPRQDKTARKPAPPRVMEVDADRPLYALEADDFAAAVLDGAAPVMRAAESVSNMAILDELRRQVGVSV